MALVEHWRTDFDTDAKVANFTYSPAPGGLGNIAGLRRVVEDSVSCIEINIGDEVPDASYFRTVAGADFDTLDAYDRMVADVPNRSDGDLLHCYSKDSTKNGAYTIEDGVLSARLGPVKPKLEDDDNHKRVAQIRLLLQSYSEAGDPIAAPVFGFPDISELNDSIGLPEEHNLDGWVMRWTTRVIGMSMGRHTKVVPHFQTRVPSMPRIGSYSWGPGGGPNGSVAYVNCIHQGTCFSDDWGFGGAGIYAPNTKDYVADSGWIESDVELRALWSYWLQLGGNDDKDAREGASYAHFLRYVVANPALWVPNWTGNAMILEAQFNPNPEVDLPTIPEGESVRGRLLIPSVSLLREAA